MIPVLVVYALCALFLVIGVNFGYCLRISHVDYYVRRFKRAGLLTETELVDGRVMIVVIPEKSL